MRTHNTMYVCFLAEQCNQSGAMLFWCRFGEVDQNVLIRKKNVWINLTNYLLTYCIHMIELRLSIIPYILIANSKKKIC